MRNTMQSIGAANPDRPAVSEDCGRPPAGRRGLGSAHGTAADRLRRRAQRFPAAPAIAGTRTGMHRRRPWPQARTPLHRPPGSRRGRGGRLDPRAQLEARLQGRRQHQPTRPTESRPGQDVHFGMGQRRPEHLPGRTSRSATRLRAAWTMVPSGMAAQAPTAMLPERSASHAWRNASCDTHPAPTKALRRCSGPRTGWPPPRASSLTACPTHVTRDASDGATIGLGSTT